MSIESGPLCVAACLLIVGAYFKIRSPAVFRGALHSAGFGVRPWFVVTVGAAEGVVGVAALAFSSAVFSLLVCISYAMFVTFLVAAMVRGWTGGCGCFGEEATPPSWSHVAVDVGCAGASGAAFIARSGGVVSTFRTYPAEASVLVMLVGACTALAYAVESLLPTVRQLSERTTQH